MAPIHEGNSADFWRYACGVSPTGQREESFGGRVYFVDSQWAAYDANHMHGSDLYRVSISDVDADLEAVCRQLDNLLEAGEEWDSTIAFKKWRDNHDANTSSALIKAIGKAHIESVVAEDPETMVYIVTREQEFWHRWQRAKWYWANICFEWVFLTGLVLFALWPTVRQQGWPKQALHLAALPLIFFLPFYLGYATFSLTSAGPTGGIVYPFLLRLTGGGRSNSVDRSILEYLPRILEPLSTPIGSPMALSGRGFPGPTYALTVGICIALAYVAISFTAARWRLHKSSVHSEC
jgi:hypothetical protein